MEANGTNETKQTRSPRYAGVVLDSAMILLGVNNRTSLHYHMSRKAEVRKLVKRLQKDYEAGRLAKLVAGSYEAYAAQLLGNSQEAAAS